MAKFFMSYQLIGNSMSNSEVGVILPTYGEAENIAKLIDDIENLKIECVHSCHR